MSSARVGLGLDWLVGVNRDRHHQNEDVLNPEEAHVDLDDVLPIEEPWENFRLQILFCGIYPALPFVM